MCLNLCVCLFFIDTNVKIEIPVCEFNGFISVIYNLAMN